MALIGDFIAVGELAAKLYNQYYRISRKAPKELSDLSKEIQTLTSAIGFMREEVKDENSIIRQAGDERTKLLATVEGQILEVLQDLDKVWKKYNDRMADAGKSRMKTAFAGLGFMNKVPDLDRYRAKLVHHNATLSLLLTSIGNKSLEQLQTTTTSIEEALREIKQCLAASKGIGVSAIPMVSNHMDDGESDEAYWISLAAKFVEQAEKERKWAQIGVFDWINAGRWWLMQAQSILQSPSRMEDSRQKNYGILNLVKAAWILVDVVVLHPQLSYLDASMQFEIRTLSVTIKEEFKACRINGFTKPPLDSFGERDLRIWDNKEDVSNFKLRPASSSYNVTARSWAANDEHILFQGFAIYKEIPCVVFFLVHEKNFHPRVLLLSQNGTILEEQRIETSPPFSDEYTPLEKLLGFTTHKFCYSYSRRRIKPSDADNEYGIDLFFPSKLTFNSVQDARRLLIRLLGLNEFIRYHSFGRIKYTRENLLVFMLLAAMLIQSDRTHTDELLAAIQSSSNYPHWDKSQLHTAVPLLIASTELASAFVMEEFFPSRYNYPFIGYRLDSYPNDSQMGLFLCLFSDARHSKFWRTRQAFMDCVAGVIFGEYKEVSDYWREWWLNFVANAISSGNAEALRFYCATFNVLSQNIPKQSHSWGTKERTAEAQSELYQYIIQEILACNPNMLTDFIGSTRIPLQELTISQPDLIRNVIVHIACCTDTSESYLSALENLANALGLHTASSDYKSSTSSACIPGEDFYSIALCVLLHDISEVKVDSVKFLLSKGANPNFLCNHSRSSPPCQVCDKTGKGKYGIYGWHTPTASAVLSDFQPREHILDLLLLVGGKLDFFYVEMPAYRERYPTRKEVALLTPSRSSMYESLNDAIDLAQKLVRTELAVQVENAEQTDVEFLRSTFRGFEVRHFSVLGCLDFQYQELTDRLDVKSLDPVPEETEWLLPRRALLLRKGAYNILLGSKLVAPSVSALDKIRSRFFERFFPNFRTCSAQISTSASILQVSEDSWCQWHEIVEESFSFKIDPERVPMYPYSFKTGSARSDCISALPSRHYSSSAFQLHHIDRSQSAQRKDGISKYYSKSKNGFKQEDYEYGNMNLNITFVSPLLYWLTNWTTLIKSFKELRVDPYMYRDLRPDEGPTVEEVD